MLSHLTVWHSRNVSKEQWIPFICIWFVNLRYGFFLFSLHKHTTHTHMFLGLPKYKRFRCWIDNTKWQIFLFLSFNENIARLRSQQYSWSCRLSLLVSNILRKFNGRRPFQTRAARCIRYALRDTRAFSAGEEHGCLGAAADFVFKHHSNEHRDAACMPNAHTYTDTMRR